MFRTVLIILTFLASFFGAGSVFAGNPFEITGVRIDAYSSNVTKAREQAIRVGTLDATYQLLDRLTLPSDRLALDPPLIITEDVAEQLVAGIEIANEKRSQSRYLAELSVTFDAQAVRTFLRVQNLPFVESQALPVLVVALWKDEDGRPVLDPYNPFAQVLKKPRFQNHLVPLILAEEGMTLDLDEEQQKAWAFANMDPVLLGALATSAKVNEIIIASAQRMGSNSVRIRARRAAFDKTGTFTVEDMGWFEGLAPTTARANAGLSRALLAATDNIAQTLDTRWKQTAIVRDDAVQSVHLTALYDSLSEWQRLRDALGGVALVEEARLDALSYDGALLTLTYFGSEEQLARRLAQKGVVLQNEDIGLVARIR